MSFETTSITSFKAYNELLITEEKNISYHICSLTHEENQGLNNEIREYQEAYNAYVKEKLTIISPNKDFLLNEKQRKLGLVFKKMFTHNPETLKKDDGSLKQNAYDLFSWSTLLRLKKQLNKIKKIFECRHTQLQHSHPCKIEWMNKSIKWLKRFEGHSYLRWGSVLLWMCKPTLLSPSVIIPISYLMPKIQKYTSTKISCLFNTIESEIEVDKCIQRLSVILSDIKQEEKFIIHSMLARLNLISINENFSFTNLILSNSASRIEIEKSLEGSHEILEELNSEEITSETFDRFHYNIISYLKNQNELDITKDFEALSWISPHEKSLRDILQQMLKKVMKLENKLIAKNNDFQQNLNISLSPFRKSLVLTVNGNKFHSTALEKLLITEDGITPRYFNEPALLDIAKYRFTLKKIDRLGTIDRIIKCSINPSQAPNDDLIELATILKDATGFLLKLKQNIEKPHSDHLDLEGFREGWKEILEAHLQEFIDYGNTILNKIQDDLNLLKTAHEHKKKFTLCNYPPLVEPFHQILIFSMKELPKPIPLIQKQVICNLNLSDLSQNIQDIKNLSFSLLTHELKHAEELSETLKHLFDYTLLLTTPEEKKHLQLLLETWNMTNPPNKIERLQHAIQSLWKEDKVHILLNTLRVMLNQIADPLSPHLSLIVEYEANKTKNNPISTFEALSTETRDSKEVNIDAPEAHRLIQLWMKKNENLSKLFIQKIMECLSSIKDNHSKSSHQITTIITDLNTHLEKLKAFAKLDTQNLENYKELNEELEKFLKEGNYPLNNKVIENFLLLHEEMLHPKENFLFKYAKFYIQKTFESGILNHESFCYKNILTHARVKDKIQPYFLLECKNTKLLYLKITHINILQTFLVKDENKIDLLNREDYEAALEEIENSFLEILRHYSEENGQGIMKSPIMDMPQVELKQISKLYLSAPTKTFRRFEQKLHKLRESLQNSDEQEIAKNTQTIAKIFDYFGTQLDLEICHFQWLSQFLKNSIFIDNENPYFFEFLDKKKEFELLISFFGTQHLTAMFNQIEDYVKSLNDQPIFEHHKLFLEPIFERRILFLENVFACTNKHSLENSQISSENIDKFYYLRSYFKTSLDNLLNRRAIEEDPLTIFDSNLNTLQKFPSAVLQEFKKSFTIHLNDAVFLINVEDNIHFFKTIIDQLVVDDDTKNECVYLLDNYHSIKSSNDWVESTVTIKIIEYNDKNDSLLVQKPLIDKLMTFLFESGENYKHIPYLTEPLKIRFISFLEKLRPLNTNLLELEIFDQLKKLCFSYFITKDLEKLVELYDAYQKKDPRDFYDKH